MGAGVGEAFPGVVLAACGARGGVTEGVLEGVQGHSEAQGEGGVDGSSLSRPGPSEARG